MRAPIARRGAMQWAGPTPTVPTLLAHAASASTTSPAIDSTGASLLIVAIANYGNDVPTVTDSKSNTWTALARNTAGGSEACLFYCSNPTVGSAHTFQVSGLTYPAILVAAFAGTLVSGAADINVMSTGSTQPGSATTAYANELVLTAASFTNSITETIDSGFTITDQTAFSGGAHEGGALAYAVKSGTINPAWDATTTNSSCSVVMASFRAA